MEVTFDDLDDNMKKQFEKFSDEEKEHALKILKKTKESADNFFGDLLHLTLKHFVELTGTIPFSDSECDNEIDDAMQAHYKRFIDGLTSNYFPQIKSLLSRYRPILDRKKNQIAFKKLDS